MAVVFSAALLVAMASPGQAQSTLQREPIAGLEEPLKAEESNLALFEGEMIDLSGDWGAATTCLIWREAGVAECFRTQKERSAREAEIESEIGPRAADFTSVRTAQCSSWLRLYKGTSWGGQELSLRDRGLWQNLASWGFSNATSSFRVGACSALFAENSWGSGALYPGSTSAHTWMSYMSSGWNNRISSVFIY